MTGQMMNRLRLLWDSSPGKKAIMAATGLIWVAYLITHMLANLLVFQGPENINAYSAFLHGTGGALWAARLVLVAALVLHVVAAVQLADRRRQARPVGYARGNDPQVSTLAARTIRWGGALILLFLVYHILHFTVGSAHPGFVEGNPYHNVATGFRNIFVVALYVVVMAFVGLHLYHGIWSGGRSLGLSPPSPHPLRRSVALALALLIWLGFSLIPIAVFAGVVR
jgi:succinate dehydrogenase / fumarate reductase cytochrome b subunit